LALTPEDELYEGQVQVIRYDYVTGDELERKIYKTYGTIGTRVTQYICPNDNTATNLTAAIEACKVPTYFAFDPARQVKPIVELDDSLTHSNFNERAYKANLYEKYDYDSIHPKSLFTRKQFERMQNQTRGPYTRVSLSPKAALSLNETAYYQNNPFQSSPYAAPIYNISLLNNEGLGNSGTDGVIKITLYNQKNGLLIAGPILFNETGMLSVGQEGKQTKKVVGVGREAIPLRYVIVGITNYDTSAWAGEVVIQAGRDEISYRAYDTEIGATKGEFTEEYRCYDGSIYSDLGDAMIRCGKHREPMNEDISRQFYLESTPEQYF